jgi:hypothetical protein
MGALASPDVGGSGLLRMRGGCRKNVYFCFGKKLFDINAVLGICVYFCLPARKSRSRKFKHLQEKMSTFGYFCIPLYTFDVWRVRVFFEINGLTATDG